MTNKCKSKKISFKDQSFFTRKLRFETGLPLSICRKAAELVNFKSIEEAKEKAKYLLLEDVRLLHKMTNKTRINCYYARKKTESYYEAFVLLTENNKTEDKIVSDQVKHYDW